jgi:ATP-dependent Clp protease adaptor protein ClpS
MTGCLWGLETHVGRQASHVPTPQPVFPVRAIISPPPPGNVEDPRRDAFLRTVMGNARLEARTLAIPTLEAIIPDFDVRRPRRLGRGVTSSLGWGRSAVFTASGGSDPPIQSPNEGEDVELEDKPVSSIPRRYKVIFHNDDYTTQEFVISVLERFFHKSETEARHIMLTVHHKGAAVAGVYTKDVAETKAQQVMDAARENGMPLLLTTEPE